MIKAARLEEIETLLRGASFLSTQQIADALGVSGATVRRDLDDLGSAGLIDRVHGGARLVTDPDRGQEDALAARDPHAEPAPADEPFDEVLGRNSETKQRLAAAAAELVAEGETLFIDIGTTVYEVARLLSGRHLTVVTNSLRVAEALGDSAQVRLEILGGEYNREYRCTQGQAVLEGLGRLHIDRAILGCSGITEQGTVRDTDASQAAVKRAAVAAAGDSTLLADASKLPGIGAFTALELSALDRLITDAPLPSALERHLSRTSLEVLVP
ncbi:DeoR/GlpR family DNA-binding transcription regulator [Brachybacterium hainanense]|uniref:Lactose phosphotransferase system repressor n=1 Tax=Brachybacterium hainanense TaxID=1541174 RepID=A0ABV6R8H1_9MICO